MKNLFQVSLAIAFFSFPQIAHASSLNLVFCSENSALLKYEVTNAEQTPSLIIRDTGTSANALTISVGNGSAEMDGNFASAWSGSNNNIEALFVNASGAQVGAVASCPE